MRFFDHLFLYIKAHFLFLKNNKAQQKRFSKPKRSAARFNKQYPNYKMGINCYGVPIIKHPHPSAILSIGNYCSIANNVEIYLGGNHRVDWVTNYPFPHFFSLANHIQDYVITKGDVNIGSDVWICQNVTILSGVTIGHGAVLANGALVTKDVEPYEIVGGNPAKHIRWRFDEETRNGLLESAWWNWSESEIFNTIDIICSEDASKFLAYAKNRS